eukprot:130403_1
MGIISATNINQHKTTVQSMRHEINLIIVYWIRVYKKWFPDVIAQLILTYAYRPLTTDPLQKVSIHDSIFKVVLIGDPFVGKSCMVYSYTCGKYESHEMISSEYVVDMDEKYDEIEDDSTDDQSEINALIVDNLHEHGFYRCTETIGNNLYSINSDSYEEYDYTIGIELYTKHIALNGESYTLHIYDAGHFANKYEYFNESDGVLMLFDITNAESFQNIKTIWHKKCKKYAPINVETILIGTKCDLEDHRKIPKPVAKEYALSNGFVDYVEISSKNMINIDYSFMQLAQSINKSLNKALNINCEYPLS